MVEGENTPRSLTAAAFVLCSVLAGGCESGEDFVYSELRIYDNPYAEVDWANDLRLKAQHHDHLEDIVADVLAYDAAGYHVVSLMRYSGNRRFAHAMRERLWPADKWIAPSLFASLKNVKLFLPNAEELGTEWRHVTSPFLTTYIEVYPPPLFLDGRFADPLLQKEPWQYLHFNEMLALIRGLGGIPCLAHPWSYGYENIPGVSCVEIYNAYAEAERYWGAKPFVDVDRNTELVANWDRALAYNQRIFGIAVNDHFGPDTIFTRLPAGIIDSGKIEVLAPAATLGAYRERFERGAFLAVRDHGTVKDSYPRIYDITVTENEAYILSGGHVRWISSGKVVADNPLLEYDLIPSGARYVRAEVSGDDGSTVYTQPFVVRPVGDVDGDYDVDSDDTTMCRNASSDVGLAVPQACIQSVN